MLYPAPQHFIAVAVAIAVATIRGVWLNVKSFGGLIGAGSGNQRIAKPLVKGAVIGLVAVRPRAGVNLRTLSVGHGDNVHHPTDRSGAVDCGARATDVFHPLDQRDRDLTDIYAIGDPRTRHRHTVDQHQHVTSLRPPNIQRSALPHAAVAGNIDPRKTTHDIV